MTMSEIETTVAVIDEEISALEEQLKALRMKRLEVCTQRAGFTVMEDRIIFNDDAIVKYALSTPPSAYKTIEELAGQKCRFFYHNKAVVLAFNAVVEITPDRHLFVSSGEGTDSIDLRSTGIRIKNITAPPVLVTDKKVKAFVFIEDREIYESD